jgi:hypothetical protein
MGNCIDDYRAAIGLFHIRITGNRRPCKFNFPVYTYQEILITNFRCTFLLMFECKCVSVTTIISNSSVKLLRKSNLFHALRIFMLHIEMELSLTLE